MSIKGRTTHFQRKYREEDVCEIVQKNPDLIADIYDYFH